MIPLISTLKHRRAASPAGCRPFLNPLLACLLAGLALIGLDAAAEPLCAADDRPIQIAQAGSRCVVYELYVKPDDERSEEAR